MKTENSLTSSKKHNNLNIKNIDWLIYKKIYINKLENIYYKSN